MSKRLLFAVLLVLVPAMAFAGPGKIRGKVIDKDSKEVLIGASVLLEGTTTGAVTDIDGNYTILNVSAGTYTVKASYVGYQSVDVSNVRVTEDITTDQNFFLSQQGVTEKPVEIVAERPLVNKNATNAIRIIDNDFFKDLPQRGVDAAVKLQPGVVSQGDNIYIRGSRPDETGFQIEGVGVNDVVFGGRGIGVSQDAVEQVTVQAGGYTAEFGGANAGIVSSELKVGNSERWKISGMAETDNYTGENNQSLGGYSYGYSDYSGTISGPLVGKSLRFFGSVENVFNRDPDSRFWDGLDFTGANALPAAAVKTGAHPDTALAQNLNIDYPAGNRIDGSRNQYSYSGTLLYDMDKLQIRGAGSYSSYDGRDPVGIANILDATRTPERLGYNGLANIRGTYFVDPKSYLEVNLSYAGQQQTVQDAAFRNDVNLYGNAAANAALGYAMEGNSTLYPLYSVYGGSGGGGISFFQPGTPYAGYDNVIQDNYEARLDYTWQLDKQELKVGGDFSRYTIRQFNPPTLSRAAILARNESPFQQYIDLVNAHDDGSFAGGQVGDDSYGYDIYGNEISSDEYVNGHLVSFGPRHPEFGAAYVEDKVELSDLTMNIGFRYDHIATDAEDISNINQPQKDPVTSLLLPTQFSITPATDQISPRLGFSFPVTDRTIFHAQYGKFIQASRLRDDYMGLGALSSIVNGGLFVTNTAGFGLQPERTTQYEMGFTQQLNDFASFDATAFYKDIQDEIQYTQIIPTGGSGSFPVLINGDFANAEGLEFTFNLRRTNRVQASINYTYSDARSTGSNPTANAGAVVASNNPDYTPHYVFSTDYNTPQQGTISLDYRYAHNDGGDILQEAGVNLLAQFNGGHSFTLESIPGANVTDPRGITPLEQLDESTTPWFFQLDMRIDKTVHFGALDANIYIYVQNLLNTQNVLEVFPRTGDPAYDGWLSTSAGQSAALQNGPQYVAMYNAIYNGNNGSVNGNPNTPGLVNNLGNLPFSNYGIPREIRFGVKLDY